MNACTDCGVRGAALCTSCERHRADGHAPQKVGRDEWCHGSAPITLDAPRLCSCGVQIDAHRKLCDTCRLAAVRTRKREQMRRRRCSTYRKRTDGRCPRCDGARERAPGQWYCQPCRTIVNTVSRVRRRERIAS